ncbi:thap domain-containing protein 9-like protein [Lasius niger]|uniref:Thap domain-containing protein 9-like protein n=1 Tax=Lasius niger TaxID=67767 RepID=A0A0J7JYY7_LASNI|nr:thap domain-containing protein 9-like protein [Lasius niger]
MITENNAKGVKLQFGLQVDEMSIKKSVEWDGKRYHGQVDLGLENDESEAATYALVYMTVCLNGHFKSPVSYYCIRSLTADVRANITNQILTVLHDNGITDIRSMIFDGASTNLGMVKHLGANIHNFEEECFLSIR